MQVADHFSAVKRRFESRAMPAYEKPPAKLVDIYYFNNMYILIIQPSIKIISLIPVIL